jgi:hypothetical protein
MAEFLYWSSFVGGRNAERLGRALSMRSVYRISVQGQNSPGTVVSVNITSVYRDGQL